jgi:hypothetical protein
VSLPIKRAESFSPLTFISIGATWAFRPIEKLEAKGIAANLVSKGVTAPVADEINVLALVKGSERYVFLYDDTSRAETLRVLGRYASNPELSFTWYDAAVLSQKIRQESRKMVHNRRFSISAPVDPDELFGD